MSNRTRKTGTDGEVWAIYTLEKWPPGTADQDTRAPTRTGTGLTTAPDQDSGPADVTADMLPRTYRRDDRDVRRDVLRALALDSVVPLSVGAQVRDGIVLLTGTVSWYRERDDAVYLAGRVPGVLGVTDNIDLIPVPRMDPELGADD
jgi:hypothetical protein